MQACTSALTRARTSPVVPVVRDVSAPLKPMERRIICSVHPDGGRAEKTDYWVWTWVFS